MYINASNKLCKPHTARTSILRVLFVNFHSMLELRAEPTELLNFMLRELLRCEEDGLPTGSVCRGRVRSRKLIDRAHRRPSSFRVLENSMAMQARWLRREQVEDSQNS